MNCSAEDGQTSHTSQSSLSLYYWITHVHFVYPPVQTVPGTYRKNILPDKGERQCGTQAHHLVSRRIAVPPPTRRPLRGVRRRLQ